MKSFTLPVVLLLLLSVFATRLSRAADGGNQPLDVGPQARFSADNFDWREMIPYLSAAAALPEEQGIKAVLENSKALRVFVANEIRGECLPDKGRCVAKREGFTLEGEVDKRIDGIVREGMVHGHKTASVDYPLQGQPFPFSEIAALKSEKRQDAYLILQLADRNYTAAQLQAKYGAPYDTNIFQWYSVFTYRLDSAAYASKAVFEVDPVDGAVIKIAISLKAKKSKKD
ncbi:MAG: hypothetical protein ABR880_21740 [Candidatus Sulfotelmatobacter sp.]|jgi:hypothetical protein